jgi:hypothetical protein
MPRLDGLRAAAPPADGGRHGGGREPRPGRRRELLPLVLLGCLALVVSLVVAFNGTHRRSDPCAPSAQLVPPCGVWWGAYVPSASNSGLTSAVQGLEQNIGRRLDIVYTYHDMSTGDDGQLITPDEQQLGRDRILMLAWSSAQWGAGPNGQDLHLSWRDIADGRYDAGVIDPQIEKVKAYGRTVLLTFDQEPEAHVGASGTAADYVAAYRHLRQRFQQLGAKNVVWVWTVTGYLSEGNPAVMSALYPGNSAVDWVAYDPYNYYACKSVSSWQSFEQTVRPGYDWLRTHISASKPIMLAEYSTAVDPAHPDAQRSWYEGIPSALASMPGIRAVLQWDSTIPGSDCDLSLDNPAALAGFTAAGHSHLFSQPVPG